MNTDDKIKIQIPEGVARNYITGFKQALGGEETDNGLEIKTGPVKMTIRFFSIEGVEFTYASICSRKPLIISRTPDNNPDLLHINIIKEGLFAHLYEGIQTNMEGGLDGNVFLYNGLFPVEGEFPANTNIKWLGFKFNITKLGPIYEGLPAVFKELFNTNEGLGYHSNLSVENDKLISDLFSFDALENGKVPLMSARALEVFTNIALHFKHEVDKEELSGLHIDDYKMLNAIKAKIVENLETSFTIDELSKEFGISPTKLKQDFKHLFGKSIYQFYTHARIEEAYRRLKTGNYSVSEIGYDLGYSNLSKFSSMFKKIKGLLPTEVVKAK
ncbi:helix-turn-helix domain-containing protein [Saccharicrinis aurantiacus]|uniref:helix-turn-helix domain-containing protein n=1 Tax=Saccharicrinis aurantiacus TaxID=1849719 RepID=UPI00095014B4|nr:AraC family transcriptional regulator [Saccharicrinis aurantiacus]